MTACVSADEIQWAESRPFSAVRARASRRVPLRGVMPGLGPGLGPGIHEL